MDLCYISALSIFCASIVGSCTSYIVTNELTIVLMKLFSAGIILSLGIVHIIPEVHIDEGYPFGSLCVLVGLIGLAIFENLSHTFTNIYVGKKEPLCVDEDIEDHHHSCIINNNLKRNVNPYIFEFACVFHSVLIGISLGVQEEEEAKMKSLLIALVFHQFLEGASIGWICNDIGKVKKVVMILVYSTSAPIGIIIGKNIYVHGVDNVMWEICLLGLSGGMLIYISLIQIFIEEMSKQELHTKENLGKKIYMYLSFLVGLASMSVIAIWL